MKTDKWNAADYADNSSAQKAWAHELIKQLGLQGDEHVLDIGCGEGAITGTIAKLVSRGKVVGIDASAEMISLARQQGHRPNLFFHVMDATNMQLQEKFDLVFSNAALHWIEDHKTLLQRLHPLLHQHSRLLFQMGGQGNAADMIKIFSQAITSSQWRQYFKDFVFPYHFYNVRQYEQWLRQTGYRANRVELIEKDMVHQNRGRLLGWLRTTWFPYTAHLPADRQEAFLTRILDNYLALFPVDAAGRTHVTMVRLNVDAEPI